MLFKAKCLARLEQQDGDLTKVKVDKVLGLVRHVAAKVAANDAVPGGRVLLVELLLDERGNVLLNVELLKSLMMMTMMVIGECICPFVRCSKRDTLLIVILYSLLPEKHSRRHPAACPQTCQHS